jgi:hypothetical protein
VNASVRNTKGVDLMQRTLRSLVLGLALLVAGGGVGYAADTFKCQTSKKIWCTKNGCKEGDGSKDYVVINLEKKSYSMCTIGKAKCDDLNLKTIKKSGIFAVFYFGGSSYLKMALQDESLIWNLKSGDFIEVRDNALGVMNSYGVCVKEK